MKKEPIDLNNVSKAEARVLIAKDVLSQLKAGKYEATIGTYCELHPRGDQYVFFDEDDVGKQLQTVLRTRMSFCDVCAQGALFVSMIRKFNKLEIDKYIAEDCESGVLGDGTTLDPLMRFFTEIQVKAIEAAFEQYPPLRVNADMDVSFALRSGVFGLQYDDMTDRMRAIMQNIIDNKGTFNPPKLSKKLEEQYMGRLAAAGRAQLGYFDLITDEREAVA